MLEFCAAGISIVASAAQLLQYLHRSSAFKRPVDRV